MVEKLTSKLCRTVDEKHGGHYYYLYCPGCKHAHPYQVPRWSFNGNNEQPSFSPSLRIYYTNPETKQEVTCCHFTLTNGVINFCDDCHDHQLRGDHPMVDFPQDYSFGDEQPFKN